MGFHCATAAVAFTAITYVHTCFRVFRPLHDKRKQDDRDGRCADSLLLCLVKDKIDTRTRPIVDGATWKS